jgi:hypothetical protein
MATARQLTLVQIRDGHFFARLNVTQGHNRYLASVVLERYFGVRRATMIDHTLHLVQSGAFRVKERASSCLIDLKYNKPNYKAIDLK